MMSEFVDSDQLLLWHDEDGRNQDEQHQRDLNRPQSQQLPAWDDDQLDQTRPLAPPDLGQTSTNRNSKGKEAIPRNNTEERGKASRKRSEEQSKSSEHHAEESGKSSRIHTKDTKGSRKRGEEHVQSSRPHAESKGSRSHTEDTKARDQRHTSSKNTNKPTPLDQLPDNTYDATYQPVDESYMDSNSSKHGTESEDYSHQRLINLDTSDPIINWGQWVHFSNGLYHREGQDSLGDWYQEDQYEEPDAPGPIRRETWYGFEGAVNYGHTPEQSLDIRDEYQDRTSDIIWGEWVRLPNGQWHREGQNSLSEWWEENRDDDPDGDRDLYAGAPDALPRVPSQSERVPSQAEVVEAIGTQTSEVNPTLAHERRLEQSDMIALPTRRSKSQGRHMIQTFQEAISELDTDTVYRMLEQSFEKIAVEEYSWLCELRKLGYSSREIGDELMEASRDGPWIFSGFQVPESQPCSPGFHIKDCLHSNRIEISQAMDRGIPPSRHIKLAVPPSNTQGQSARESIEYFCGIGGVSPMPTGVHETQFGSVKFEDSNSTAIVSFRSPSKRSGTGSSLHDVLVNLTRAIGVLQRSGGCCDSFTFLSLSSEQSFIELHRTQLLLVENLFRATEGQEPQHPTLANRASTFFSQTFGKADHEPLSLALQAQFLCLAFLSYSQAHCGPIRPFFLDTPLRRVILIGDNEWHEKFQGPCIIGSLMNLSCFGDMLQEPVFNFRYHHGPGVKTLSQPDLRFDLFAEPEDVLDTWGPGELVTPKDDPTKLHAISIGTGYVIPLPRSKFGGTTTNLHWSQESKPSTLTTFTFPRSGKAIIGTRIFSNINCKGEPLVQIQRADGLLKYLGTFGTSWEVTERQFGFGLQGGATIVSVFQFGQTWAKRKPQTIKTTFLAQRPLNILDLDAFFAIQISVCTGIARRVRLRDLLAEILRTYAAAPVAKSPGFRSLYAKLGMIEALRDGNLVDWYDQLEYELQVTFENLVFEVLSVLKDTGVDRNGEKFIVGCIQPGIPFRCFHIPCKKENYWTRIAADSEEFATFAYMTTVCLETDVVKCRGPSSLWVNSTAFLCTAVSCYDNGNDTTNPAQWTLKDSESYLIGKSDAPLIVDVERPNAREEPRLLVSLSKIWPEILVRLNRKGKNGKPRRLQEKTMINQIAEPVVVVANQK